MSYRLSADIGGTFTDVVCINDETGEYTTTKVLTTPEKLTNGIMQGFDEVIGKKYQQVKNIVHGTTSGLNAVIERKGAKCAIITTRGFGDVLEIGRGNRPDMYNNRYQRPKPLVSRGDIYEVDERVSADGSVKLPLQTDSLKEIFDQIQGNYESIAVCFINSTSTRKMRKKRQNGSKNGWETRLWSLLPLKRPGNGGSMRELVQRFSMPMYRPSPKAIW